MTPSERIDQMIADFQDRRGPMLAGLRKIILEADAALDRQQ